MALVGLEVALEKASGIGSKVRNGEPRATRFPPVQDSPRPVTGLDSQSGSRRSFPPIQVNTRSLVRVDSARSKDADAGDLAERG
jgi:hypothetical protein